MAPQPPPTLVAPRPSRGAPRSPNARGAPAQPGRSSETPRYSESLPRQPATTVRARRVGSPVRPTLARTPRARPPIPKGGRSEVSRIAGGALSASCASRGRHGSPNGARAAPHPVAAVCRIPVLFTVAPPETAIVRPRHRHGSHSLNGREVSGDGAGRWFVTPDEFDERHVRRNF